MVAEILENWKLCVAVAMSRPGYAAIADRPDVARSLRGHHAPRRAGLAGDMKLILRCAKLSVEKRQAAN
jgi:hypothetical protein